MGCNLNSLILQGLKAQIESMNGKETYLFDLAISLQPGTIYRSSNGDASNSGSHDPPADSLRSLGCGHDMCSRYDKGERYVWLRQWRRLRSKWWEMEKAQELWRESVRVPRPFAAGVFVAPPLFRSDNKQHLPRRPLIHDPQIPAPDDCVDQRRIVLRCRTTLDQALRASAACPRRSPASSRTSRHNSRN